MKKKVYSFLILAALFTTSIFAQDLTTGLKLHYTFDDVVGTLVPDASGNGQAGTFMGAAVTAEGHTGPAVSLTNVNDYVQLPNDITTTLTDYTVACWVNLNTVNNSNGDNYWGRIFDFGNGTAINMFMAPQNGAPYYAIKPSDVVGEQSVKSSGFLTPNAWYHVAVTCSFNETTGLGVLRMYLNGSIVATKSDVTTTPASMGTTLQNYIGKSQYADPTINGKIDDFRIYSRALTTDDIMTLNGIPAALISAYKSLAIAGTLTEVIDNLTLPTTVGSDGVTVSWASTDSATVSPLGVVVRPEKYKAAVKLTATLSITVSEVTTTLTKTFDIIVLPMKDASEILAIWNFADSTVQTVDGVTTVKDISDNAFVATCVAGAQIVSIGNTEKFNVLSIANAGEYFDFGTDIGEAVYGLTDYTVSVFFRKDTTDGTIDWARYGQPLYGFSNGLDLGTTAIGAMYFEPRRARHVNTPDNYGSEPSNFVGGSDLTGLVTPLGTWHNVTYSQTGGVGVLYFDGVQYATGAMQAPAITLKRTGQKGTLYNSIGRPFYTGDPQLTNTLIYGFHMYSVGLTVDDLATELDIQNTISALDIAYNSLTYDIYLYAILDGFLKDAKKAAESNFTPGLAALNAAIAIAQADYDGKIPTEAGNVALSDATTAYNTAAAPWIELAALIATTDAHIALGYPGLAVFNVALQAAKDAYAAYNVTAETISTLTTAIATYLKTQPASAAKPMDYTFVITNPSFEVTTGGKLDSTSYRNGSATGTGTYQYPNGWTLYLNHTGSCNAVSITAAPSDGVRAFETWAATINEFNVYQNVDLNAGYYILSGQLRTNAGAPYTQHIYATTAENTTFVSQNLVDSLVFTDARWNTMANWQTLYCVFNTAGGNTRVGFRANGFMQFDNMKLAYYGPDIPANGNFTTTLANPGFEEGTQTAEYVGIDTTSVYTATIAATGADRGNFFSPIGWNTHINVDTTALSGTWTNTVGISGSSMSEGTKGFEMWNGYIKEFNLSQDVEAPATGLFKLTADVRCDESSPSKTDPIRYDARLFAKVGNFAQTESAKFGEGDTSLVWGDWASLTAWRTLALNIKASVGETINLGIVSSSFMQLDNFTLTYYAIADSSGAYVTKIVENASSAPSVEIYPNPASSYLNIRGLDAMSIVRVFNTTGQQLFVSKANSNMISIDLSKYSQGLYLLQVVSNGKVVTSKFIKK